VTPDSGTPSTVGQPEADRTLRLLLYDGVASETMSSLTTGVFLAGFALELGATNLQIGALAAIPALTQLIQIPAVLLVEHLRVRRRIAVIASVIGRTALMATAVTPLLPWPYSIYALIAYLSIHQGFAAVAGCAWNSWMRDLVPQEMFGRFFGKRTAIITALAIVLGILGGFLIDAWKRHEPGMPSVGYAAMFAIGAAIGFIGSYMMAITPEPPMPPRLQHEPMRRLLAAPFHDENFRRLMIFLAAWNFSTNLAAPFFTVYMLKMLGYPMTLVIGLNIVSQLSNLAFLGRWGKLIDRFNNKAVLGICAPLFLLCILGWTLTGMPWMAGMVLPLLVVLHALMGLSTAGVGLASGNIAMKLSPVGKSTAYLAANSVIIAVSSGLAPIIGGACADFFAARELALAFTWKAPFHEVTVNLFSLHAWTFFFALAALLGLYSLHRLTAVEEVGSVDDRAVWQNLFLEMRRSVHGFSSVAGLARLARFPAALLSGRLNL
jgi:MFS family permease